MYTFEENTPYNEFLIMKDNEIICRVNKTDYNFDDEALRAANLICKLLNELK